MLNGAAVNDANERSGQTLQPYQSLWLAHWKPSASDAAGDNASASASRREELHHKKRPEPSSRSANGVGTVKNTTFEISHNFNKIGRKSVGNPLKESVVESSFHIFPDESDIKTDRFNKGKAIVSLGLRQISSENEQCCGERQTDLLCDNSSVMCLRERVSCDHCSPVINGVLFLKMQKCCPGIRLSLSQSNSCKENETSISHIDCCSKLKLQKHGHGLGTMRIFSGTDVPEGARDGMDYLLTTKNNGVDPFKENDMFTRKRVSTRICDLPIFCHNKQKVQHHAQSNLNGGYLGDVKASKVIIRNELSAETDTMELDSLKEKKFMKNLHSAASNSTTSTKAFDMESEIVCSTKVEQRWLNNKLPDINLTPPTSPCSPLISCLTSSKALTMTTEKLHEHVKQPKANSDSSQVEFPITDTGNRWVKRLKLSSSNSSTPNYASISPREGMSRRFNGIPRSNTKTRSKPNERSLVLDKSEDSSKMDKAKALLVSHAWIQRWLRSGGRETKRECVIESSRLAVEEEEFPSIAAMALMSKVLTCVQLCELQKKGAYTVWNTKSTV